MPRIKEIKRCRATVVVTRNQYGNPATVRQCLAPATREGYADCEHGEAARKWVAAFAPAA